MEREDCLQSAVWNSPAREFLQFLAAHEIWDVVLFGGAIRDAILGDRIQDWDVAIVLPDPGTTLAARSTNDYVILPQTRKPFERLARALDDISLEDLVQERAEFQGRRIDLLGLRPAFTPDGIAFPDIFATTTFDTRVCGSAVLTVNQLAVDAVGRIYGRQHAEDLLQRRIVFATPPQVKTRALYGMARLLVQARRSRLTLPVSTRNVVKLHLQTLRTCPALISDGLCLPELRKLSSAPELADLVWEPDRVITSMQKALESIPEESLANRGRLDS